VIAPRDTPLSLHHRGTSREQRAASAGQTACRPRLLPSCQLPSLPVTMTAWRKLLEPKHRLDSKTFLQKLATQNVGRRLRSDVNINRNKSIFCMLPERIQFVSEKSHQPFLFFTKAPGGTIRWRALTYNNTQKAQLLLPSPTVASASPYQRRVAQQRLARVSVTMVMARCFFARKDREIVK